MTPGQKQMLAIRDLIRAEVDRATAPAASNYRTHADIAAYAAFIELCEAFGHEVPAE